MGHRGTNVHNAGVYSLSCRFCGHERNPMRYITPEHCIQNRLGTRSAPSWDAGLLVFRDRAHSQELLDEFDAVEPIQHRLLYNTPDDPVEPTACAADVRGKKIGIVTRCVWGGPQAAILVEELAYLGVPTVLGYGVSGSMDADLPQGRLILADSALPTDGTSKAYGGASRLLADTDLVDATKGAANALDLDVAPATAVTVDALYRETPELIAELRRQGGQIINLETSTLYTVAATCGIRSLWLGYVSDCIADGKWHDWFADVGATSRATCRLCRAVLESVLAE